MTQYDKNSPPPDALNRALELVSRQIDGDLSDAESAELASLESHFSAAVGGFRGRCQRLHSDLRQIPVQAVNGLLCAVPLEAQGAAGQTRVGRRKGVTWRSIAVVMAGCLLLAIVRPWEQTSETSSLSDANPPVASNQSSPESGMIRGRTDSIDFSAAAEIAAVDMSEEDAGAPPNDGFSVQTLLESTNWNIVVVNLDEKDRDLAMQRIHSILREHGLRLQNPSVASVAGQSDFVGVVLTAADSQNEELVNAMEERVANTPVERDQTEIAESRREEIIEAVRNSLQHPTRSELHYGTIYVAVSTGRQDSSSPINSAIAGSAAELNDSVADATPLAPSSNDLSVNGAPVAAGKLSKRPLAAVTLVVFEFGSSDGDPNGDSSESPNEKGLGQPL